MKYGRRTDIFLHRGAMKTGKKRVVPPSATSRERVMVNSVKTSLGKSRIRKYRGRVFPVRYSVCIPGHPMLSQVLSWPAVLGRSLQISPRLTRRCRLAYLFYSSHQFQADPG